MATPEPAKGRDNALIQNGSADDDLEQAWAKLREERDRRLEIVDGLFLRHIEQCASGFPTTLTQRQFERLLAYQQVLRDLPKRTADPTRPVWPPEPF